MTHRTASQWGAMAAVLWGTAIAVASACASDAGAGPLTTESASPLKRSTKAADLAVTPPGGVALELDFGDVSPLWNAKSVRLTQMPMPGGEDVTLDLRAVENPVGAIWYYGAGAAGGPELEHVATPPVLMFAGTVEGVPGSSVFLGMAERQAHGWIETAEGLHLLATPPGGGTTILYRVGKELGGVDVPPPALGVDINRLQGATRTRGAEAGVGRTANPFIPIGDHATVLRDLQIPGSAIRDRFLEVSGPRRLPQMLELLTRDDDDVDPEYQLGACCVLPGMCLYLTAEVCSGFCSSDTDTFCGNTWNGLPIDFDTGNLPPCWLGPEVPCGGAWSCFETDPDALPGDPSYQNWIGACCLDFDGDGITEVVQMEACQCGIMGGRFVAPPAQCLGEDLAEPQKMDAINFVSADTINAIDPDICSKPQGACCFEQEILCEDIADPDDPIYDQFLRVTCLQLPQALCEDAAILDDTFNGTGTPGYFVAECYPCVSTNEGDSVCPSSMQLETGGVGPPIQLECQVPRVAVDTDWWFLERFDGDASAAGTYVTLLMTSINAILERDALVTMQIGDVVLRGETQLDVGNLGDPGMDYLLRGACCIEDLNECWERRTQQWCRDQEDVHGHTTTWLGPGSSCWDATGTPCPGNNATVHDNDDATPFTISDMWGLMNDEWSRIANTADHPLSSVATGSNLVLLLSGYPFERPYWALPLTAPDPYLYQEWGIVPQIADAGTTRVLCSDSDSPYAVAAAQGGFPWPGTPFDRGNANWDLIAATRALVLAIGVDPTNAYGLDDCIGPPCLDVSLTPDCLHRHYYDGLRDFAVTPQSSAMPPTLMSYCITCPGESANLQLRFRSEIAARIYARFATMSCEAGVGGLEIASSTQPYAVDDFYIEPPVSVHYLDVVANDVAPGCLDQNAFDAGAWDPGSFDPATDPWPEFPLVLTRLELDPPDLDPLEAPWWSYPATPLPAMTVMGGIIDIVDDPNNPGTDVVQYTPPAEFCGIDYFYYEVTTVPPIVPDPDSPDPDNPDPLWLPESTTGLVRITQQSCSGGARPIQDLPNYPPESVTEPTLPPTPPVPGAAALLALDGLVTGRRLEYVSWEGMELTLVDPFATAPGEAFFRVWGVREAGASLYDTCEDGNPCAVFYDVHPFGSGGECGPGSPFVWGGQNPVGPISGQCAPPDEFFFMPSEGELLIQCLEESDDIPGADAFWTAGEFCVVVDEVSAEGVCCLDGLCVITTPFDCAAMGWSWEWVPPDPLTCQGPSNPNYRWEWTYDSARAGFFMGNGTTCEERDWCRRTAPCCYDRPNDGGPACALLTCEECLQLGGRMLTWGRANAHGVMDFFDGTQWCDPDPDWADIDGPPQPLWDTPCEYPGCDLDFSAYPAGIPLPIEPPDPSNTIGACCVLADDLDPTNPGGRVRYCTDLNRANCELLAGDPDVVSTSWSIRGRCEDVPCAPLGACCRLDVDGNPLACTDSVSFEECLDLWADGSTLVAFTPNASCADGPCDPAAVGGCCLPATGACCDNLTQEVCGLISGVFLGDGADCSTCGAVASTGVCSIDFNGIGVCTDGVTQNVCEVSLDGEWFADIAACNESMPEVGSGMGGPLGGCCYEFECISAVAEDDCLLSGGFPIPKSDNPYHPNCEPTTGPAVLGACCYHNDRYGDVCVDVTQAVCASLSGTWCASGLCDSGCPDDPNWASCSDINFCAPGNCAVTWRRDTGGDGCPDGTWTNTFIAANPERCGSRDGVWQGQVSPASLPPRTVGDLDGDGRVGAEDLLMMLRAWGYADQRADLDGSGRVDAGDLHRMMQLWKPR